MIRNRLIPAEMVGPVSIEFPLRTVSAANAREHHFAKARRVKRERGTTALFLNNLPLPPLPVVVTLTRLAPRQLDTGDNLPMALKSIRDELAARYGVDDRDERYVWRYEQEKSKTYGVRIDIRPIVAALAISRPASHGRHLGRAK